MKRPNWAHSQPVSLVPEPAPFCLLSSVALNLIRSTARHKSFAASPMTKGSTSSKLANQAPNEDLAGLGVGKGASVDVEATGSTRVGVGSLYRSMTMTTVS